MTNRVNQFFAHLRRRLPGPIGLSRDGPFRRGPVGISEARAAAQVHPGPVTAIGNIERVAREIEDSRANIKSVSDARVVAVLRKHQATLARHKRLLLDQSAPDAGGSRRAKQRLVGDMSNRTAQPPAHGAGKKVLVDAATRDVRQAGAEFRKSPNDENLKRYVIKHFEARGVAGDSVAMPPVFAASMLADITATLREVRAGRPGGVLRTHPWMLALETLMRDYIQPGAEQENDNDKKKEVAEDKPPPQRAPQQQEKTWIEIELLYADNGDPVPSARLVLTGTDGNQSFKTTNASGIIRVSGIDAGECTIGCKLKSAQLSRTLAFAGTGSADGSAGNSAPARPKSGGKPLHVADIEARKVKKGDSIQSLADEIGMTWQKLAEFNWGTADPAAINEHLRDEVGCTRKTANGQNYVFDDTDKPGIVYLPTEWELDGLATGAAHTIRVNFIAPYYLLLENEVGLRIPEAAYEATLADESVQKGTLGIGGVDAILNPPDGAVLVNFPDSDDILAKSLAACARQSFDDRDPQELYRVLRQEPEVVNAAVAAYEQYFNDHTGNGFVEDIYAEITDPDAAMAVSVELTRCGIEARHELEIVSIEEQRSEDEEPVEA